jgi:hypothetical protein
MSKVTTPEESTVIEIRKLLEKRSGTKSALSKISDADMWGLFQLLRAGTSLTEAAEWLHKRGILTNSSVDSTRKAVGKFKTAIAQLFLPPPRKPLPSPRQTVATSDLEKVSQITDLYLGVLQDELEAAQAGAPLSPHLSKHASGLAQLLRAKKMLESTMKKQPNDLTHEEHGKLAAALGKINPDTMNDLAKRFISGIEGQCLTLEEYEDGTLRVADVEQRH